VDELTEAIMVAATTEAVATGPLRGSRRRRRGEPRHPPRVELLPRSLMLALLEIGL
jgi:hypothetical protein